MNRLFFFVVLGLLLPIPTLICKAEMTGLIEISSQHIPPHLLNKQNLPNQPTPDITAIHYAFSNLTFDNGPVREVKLDHRREKTGKSLSLMKTAEADMPPNEILFKDFEKISNTINDASRLSDLSPVLSENNFQLLKAKVKTGVSQYVVLAFIQSMRPQNIYVIDVAIEQDHATLAVAGRSYFGRMQGLIHLVKIKEACKIEQEDWFAAAKNNKDHIVILATDNKNINVRPSGGLLAEVTPDYRINKNSLALTKVPYTKDKRSLNFLFLMNKDKTYSNKSENSLVAEQTTVLKDNARARMHILWTGSKKLMIEQKLIEHEYPIDVSIANYEDGYAPGQWNLILPNKKPRQVIFSLLWSF